MNASYDCAMEKHPSADPLLSCRDIFIARVQTNTWAFISLVQPKKRANTLTQYWYCDTSLIVLKRKLMSNDVWEGEKAVFQGVQRVCDCEVFLDPKYEYCFLPFSHICGGGVCNSTIQGEYKGRSRFRFTTYSSNEIFLEKKKRHQMAHILFVTALHKELLKTERKIQYVLGPQCTLVAIQGPGCVYFVVANASHSNFMLLHLTIEMKRGVLLVYGQNADTHAVPPRTQSIILVLASDGRFSSDSVSFSYKTDSQQSKLKSQSPGSPVTPKKYPYAGLGTKLELTIAGDYLASGVSTRGECMNGKGTLDASLWTALQNQGAMI